MAVGIGIFVGGLIVGLVIGAVSTFIFCMGMMPWR